MAERRLVAPEPLPFPSVAPAAVSPAAQDGPDDGLHALLAQRRSIRKLRSGPFSPAAEARILEAVRLTPSAFNQPSWHVVLVHAERDALWDEVEAGFRAGLGGDPDRLARYLDRLAGFREGVAVALVYEDVPVRDELVAAWRITDEQARAFAEQGLGMVQLSLWLALTAEGLVTSLQHWEWLVEERLAAFVGLPRERYRLAATLPIGYADEAPRPTQRVRLDAVVSRERYQGAAAESTSV